MCAMAKVLLILPKLPQPMGAPYLGQQYVAASLLADGHEVRCLDQAARLWPGETDEASDEAVIRAAEAFEPDLIGMTLFTYNALRGYRLAAKLKGRARLLVAGGPHPTITRDEPLRFGFDVSVVGEGERRVVELARWLDDPSAIRPAGVLTAPPIDDLDALAYPLESYPSFELSHYGLAGGVAPGGMMTSRGCPARCTFCANYVTGRGYRWRSAGDILGEMRALRTRFGVTHFPFWDDAFTARRPRLYTLCEAISSDPDLAGVTWDCITPGIMVRDFDLRKMYAAGCRTINFGIESGDLNVLATIQKGQRPRHVKAAVEAAKRAGMRTIVNFMFGFPGEDLDALGRTLDLMRELADWTDFFNNRGVLVPFPGTAIYDAHHEAYGFTEWWLDPARIPAEPDYASMDPAAIQAALETDPTLDLDYFHYSDPVRERIAECVRFKALHNQETARMPHALRVPSAA